MQIMMSSYNILYLLCTLLPFVKTAQELETGSIKFADIEAHYQLYDVPGDGVCMKFTDFSYVSDLGNITFQPDQMCLLSCFFMALSSPPKIG
jgi:hypothetical protein